MYRFLGLIASFFISDHDLECFGFWRHNSGHRGVVFCCCIVDTLSVVSVDGSPSLLFAVDLRFQTFPTLDNVLG
jgi:hypothetical protein